MKNSYTGRPPPAMHPGDADSQTKNRRINQLYKSLMQCNQAIVRSDSEQILFSEICRNVVSFDCMKMACISMLDETGQQLASVAADGDGTDYLEQLPVSIVAETTYGRGPSGIAFRENRPYWCQDFQHDPATLPWRERATRFDWKACAALPLHRKGMVIGTINLYADQVDAFDATTRNLLMELAIDIDYALSRFELEAERQHSLKMKTLRVFMLELMTSELPLKEILLNVVYQLEAIIPDSLCSIMLRDKDSLRLRVGAAPSLPGFYNAAIDGMSISLGVGCCPNTIASGSRTIVSDIARDPLWTAFASIAAKAELGSCWSEPIFSADAQVIGAFAVYHRNPYTPEKYDLQLIETAAHFVAIAIERKQSEAFLRKLSHAVEQSSNAILITGLDGVIEYANTAFSVNSGYAIDEVIGKKPSLHRSGKTPPATYADMWAHLARGESWHGEFINRRKNGSEHVDLVHISPVREADGCITHYLAIEEDITDRKNAQAHIKYLAHYDVLTGLPNRVLLDERAHDALQAAEKNRDALAVMFIDLDHFKNINDTLGHSLGDTLLVALSQRLQLVLGPDDTLSRLGGDEFILLQPGANREDARKTVQELMGIIKQPYQIGPHDLSVMASIGIAVYPEDGADFETLHKNADVAMYRAKEAGRNSYQFFTQEMQESSARYLTIVNALRHAVEHNQLELHYQPQISLSDDRIIGAEALLRWRHPELGNVSPAEFIPIAEEGGLIMQIGEWVLRTAVRQAKAWHERGYTALLMAVNLSAVQFRHAGLPDLVMRILKEADFPPQYLELELTEGVAMHNPQGAIAMMNNLHAHGVRMSIDDFGTGYSSLSYLKKFKVYRLKIDQSFVRDISSDAEDRALVSAIIGMAKSLGLQTIAEGVETLEQLAFLRAEGCHEAQGYHYSKPLPVAAFEDFLAATLSAVRVLRSATR